MANRTVKTTGKGTDVNAEGNEKLDNTSTTTGELASLSLHDDNAKLAGLANGKRLSDNKNSLGNQSQ
jgi:hypothetical protein